MNKLSVIIFLFCLSNCAPAAFSGSVFTGKLFFQDKTIGESFSDTSIWTKIKSKMMHKKIDDLLGTITIKVDEGRVLLTGSVPNREAIIEVLKICWDTQGVKEVINELKVKNKNQGSFATYTKDSWITTQARSKMFFSDIKSVNFSLETIDSTVYLFGIARSQSELEKATDKISAINGVKKVVSYIRVVKDIHERIQSTKGDKPKQEYIDISDIEDEQSQQLNNKYGKLEIQDEVEEVDELKPKNQKTVGKKYGKVEINEDQIFDKDYNQ